MKSNSKQEESRKRAVVLMMPYFDDNPYQDLLVRSLEKEGADVIKSSYRWSIFGKCKAFGVTAFHLHWTHPWTVRTGKIAFFLKLVVWTFQLVMLRLTGVKVVWTVHNLKDHENSMPVRDRVFNVVNSVFASRLIAHSEQAAIKVAHSFPVPLGKIRTIRHGHYLEWYDHSASREEARTILKVDLDALVFVAFGAVRPYKNTLELIEQFKRIKSDNVVLLVAGSYRDEAYANRVRSAAAEAKTNIRLDLRHIPDSQVKFLMRAADVAVFPYADILTSGAVVLAMGFELPCVLPNLRSFRELPGDSGGFLYDVTDCDGLYMAMNRAVEESAQLRQKGDLNRKRIESHSWEDVARETIECYS